MNEIQFTKHMQAIFYEKDQKQNVKIQILDNYNS